MARSGLLVLPVPPPPLAELPPILLLVALLLLLGEMVATDDIVETARPAIGTASAGVVPLLWGGEVLTYSHG
uniref:Uncharacterized protein n=1 Tax=Anopheles darlingi TaxID=43151 RepID=A0A2M4DII0_ANODA